MADNKIALDILINTDKANLTLGELEDGLAAANEKLRELPRGSKAFNDLAQEITLANKEVKNLELSMEALDSEQVASEMGGLAGSIGDVTAAFVLLGGENETMEELAANIELAMGISIGFKGAIEGISSASKLWNNLIKVSTKQMSGLTKAIAATGIGALVVAIGTLIYYWEDLTEAIGINTAAQRLNTEVTNQALETVAEELSAADKLKKKLDDENLTRSEKNDAIRELQEEYPYLLSNIDAETSSIEEVNKALELNTKLLVLRAKQEAIASLRAEEFKEQLKAQAEAQTGANVGWLETLQGLSTGIDAQTFATAKTYDSIKASKEQVNALDDLDASIQAEIDSLVNLGAVGEKEVKVQEKRIQKSKENAEALRKEIEARKELDKARTIDAQNIAQEEIKIVEEKNNYLFDAIKMMYQVEEEAHQRKLERLAEEDEARQQQIDKAQAGLDVLNAGADLFIKDEIKREKIKKKLAVAQLAIDTARAISSGIASASAVPFPGNIAAILSTVATVLANVAQAKNLLSSAGVSGAGDLGSAGQSASGASGGVDINAVSNTSTVLSNQKVVVAEGDITNVQQKVMVAENYATF